MKDIKVIIGILVGNTIYALAVAMFILPNDLITGGTTGIALFLNTTLNIPVTLFVSIFNICMFLLGWKILGKKFALTTLISSFYYPFILGILENIFKNEIMSNDTLLCVIFAGIMIGVAIGSKLIDLTSLTNHRYALIGIYVFSLCASLYKLFLILVEQNL